MQTHEELDQFRSSVKSWIQDHLPQDLRQKVLEHKRLGKDDLLRWHHILYRQGWAAPGWPPEHGGPGWCIMRRHIFDEECAIAGAPEVPPFGVRMVAPVLMKYGTPAQQAYYLPRILAGEDWWCQGYSEPGSGSDLASLKTRAELTAEGFVVNGQKTWTTYAQYADMMFCLVRTATVPKPQEGISFLLVDMKTPGISIRPIRTLDGDTEINDVFLDNVHVPARNLVGEVNRGWSCAKYLLSHERFGAARVGRAKRELAILKRIAVERQVDGQSLSMDPVFAQALSSLEVDLLALEQTNLRLIERVQRNGGNGAEASILKLLGTTLTQSITEKMVEATGVHALPFEQNAFALRTDGNPENEWASPLAGFYLNLRKISIYGGTDEVQKNIIARTALGL